MIATRSAYSIAADRLTESWPTLSNEQWCRAELPHLFPLDFGAHHHWLFNVIDSDGPTGVRAFEAAPRGTGKTTAASIGLPLATIARGSHRFPVIVGTTQDEGIARLRIIRGELERNPGIAERWPNLRYVPGRRGHKLDHEDEIQLIGGRIVVKGAGARLRGLVRETDNGSLARPDLFIFDDIETPEQARSKLRTDRLEEWVFADVSNLGGPPGAKSNPNLDIVGIGTTLEPNALATRAINNKGRFRSWQTVAFPAEIKDAKGRRRAAWPEGQPLAYLDRLLDVNDELFLGRDTYAKEYLLNPRRRTGTLIVPEQLRYGKCPETLSYAAIGIDPRANEQAIEKGDYTAFVEVGLELGDTPKVWVRRAWHGHPTPGRTLDLAADWHKGFGASIAFEAVGGFSWALAEFRRRLLPTRPVKPKTDKVSRFQTTALLYERGIVWHDESLADSEFEAELLDFPGGEHDDFVDALWLAATFATNEGRRTPPGNTKSEEAA